MTGVTRYAVRSSAETWVSACAAFFAEHGEFDRYTVPREQAIGEIMKHAGGSLNPSYVRVKVTSMYAMAGVRCE